MPKNQAISPDKNKVEQSQPRFIKAFVVGAFAGVFIGLLAMALSILIVGIMSLFLPELTFQLAGISVTAVTFVVFCALGWIGATLIIWHKLSLVPET